MPNSWSYPSGTSPRDWQGRLPDAYPGAVTEAIPSWPEKQLQEPAPDREPAVRHLTDFASVRVAIVAASLAAIMLSLGLAALTIRLVWALWPR